MQRKRRKPLEVQVQQLGGCKLFAIQPKLPPYEALRPDCRFVDLFAFFFSSQSVGGADNE